MPRRPHPLTEVVRRTLRPPLGPRARAFLGLLDRRLRALEGLARGETVAIPAGPAERTLARRFLRPRQGRWHDGDENRVRGDLDRWRPKQDPPQAEAAALLRAAEALSRGASPGALWFYLWILESMLESGPLENAPRRR